MGVLIDLDQTLIDSQIAAQLRKNRQWPTVYEMVSQLSPYPGITELLRELKELDIPICIITSSPRPYCERIINYWGWQIDATVCYHDTSRHKPEPEPIQKGLLSLGLQANNAVAVGDAASDIRAAKAAGVFSIGTLWGCLEKSLLTASQPDIICVNVQELRDFLLNKSRYLN